MSAESSSIASTYPVASPLLPFGGGKRVPSMTSEDIADVVTARHDNVRRTIERLADRSVITLPPLEEKPSAGRPGKVYVFSGEQGKRDSIIVVAQLSPEFTAQLVDRWQALEAEVRKPAIPRSTAVRIDVAREQRLNLALNLKMAKMAGLSGTQALLSAARAAAAMTGIDHLNLMGLTHMDAPQNEALLNPTEIGQRSGIGPAQAVNERLCAAGLQIRYHDAKGRPYYEPTEAGKRAGGVMQDTGKKHSTGAPVRQLRWASSIIAVLTGGEGMAA